MTNVRPSPLIDVAELAAAMESDRPPTVLDVRWALNGPPGIEDYRAGHIPGAAFLDLDRDLSAPPGVAGRHPLPDASNVQEAMRAAGVDTDRPVVVYDAGDAMPAARCWWTLRYFGHPDVRVLDGGYRAWTDAGWAVRRTETATPTGDFTARPGGAAILDAEDAARVARHGLLLDVRAPERYRGETEPIDPVAGHIPGAVNAPAGEDIGPDGRFRPAGELAARYGELGASADVTLGAYCGSGVSAAREVLALTIAGMPAALYVGSWSNWIADPSRPVATGASPA